MFLIHNYFNLFLGRLCTVVTYNKYLFECILLIIFVHVNFTNSMYLIKQIFRMTSTLLGIIEHLHVYNIH